jgi:hypothetical protein
MRLALGLALAAALPGTVPALAQASLNRPRPAEHDLQDLNALTLQRQQDALRQGQQAFDRSQRELEAERRSGFRLLPGDPDRDSMFRR